METLLAAPCIDNNEETFSLSCFLDDRNDATAAALRLLGGESVGVETDEEFFTSDGEQDIVFGDDDVDLLE